MNDSLITELYRKMLTIRLAETELQKLCLQGVAGDLHFNKGQEAISVGAITALQPNDYIVTHHRTIAHTYVKGTPLKPLLAELLGRANGTNKGLAGEMHFRNPAVGHLFSFQLVGTSIPVAAGLAWATKYFRNESKVVACFIGDAVTSNAQFHEGMNIAALKKVPLLIISENNGLAGNIRQSVYMPTKTVAERAAAYGIRALRIDGNDVIGVYEAVKGVYKIVQEESQPYLLDCVTTRLCWHKQGQPDARSKEEIAELSKLDPIPRLEQLIPENERERIASLAQAEVTEALEYAMSSPWPDPDTVIPQLVHL
jgi:TPP-dependent pyruvate/acetoin dehydrogenase alpha subunit